MADDAISGSKPRRIFGRDEANVDDKGRILLSKKKRDWLGEEFVMCQGDHGCIYAFSADEWDTIVDRVLSHDPINQGRRVYTRLVLGTAEDGLNCDQQGRVVVPRKLRELAKLDSKVVLIGCADRVEIWAEEEWLKYEQYPESYAGERIATIRNAQNEMKDQ